MQAWTPVQVRQLSRTIVKPHLQRTLRNTASSTAKASLSQQEKLFKRVIVDSAQVPEGEAFKRLDIEKSWHRHEEEQHEEQEPLLDEENGHDTRLEAEGAWHTGISHGSSRIQIKDFRQPRRAEDLPRSPLIQRYTDGKHGGMGKNRRNSLYSERASDKNGIERENPLHPVKRGRPVEFKKLMKVAPFATRFQMNAFAHALAAPVREDCFTGAHLPSSCLLDFKVLNTDPTKGDQALLPVSLAAEMIPAKKPLHKMTKEEIQIRKAYHEELNTPRQTFAGSYILNSEEAVRFVTDDPAKRVPLMVLSRRLHEAISDKRVASEMKWRDDMPDFLLGAMRKITLKKLGFLIRSKGNKDKPGMLCAVPGEGLEHLDEMVAVACVLRLRPVGMPDAREQEDEDEMPGYGLHSKDSPLGASEDIEAEHTSSDIEAVFSEHESAASEEDDVNATSEEEDADPNTTRHQVDEPTPPRKRLDVPATTWWTDSDPIHRNTLPLPPPLKIPSLHYPSVSYRRRRVPLYDLPTLLGDEALEKMIKGSVFDGTTYVAVAHALGTIAAGAWLLKFQGFVAQRRVQE